MQHVWIALLAAALLACHAPRATVRPASEASAPARASMPGFPKRLRFQLTHLDGKPLPTPNVDPRGRYTLTAGELRLDPDGSMWFILDQVPDPDTTGGHPLRGTLVESYRRIGADGLQFPGGAEGNEPEFFGRRAGRELVLTARPLPAPQFSIAREHGGAHEWRFVER